ncbi:hypothetical protein [Pseudomonas iridis]|uniref:hypothetical protein n=1 Tax=Pseudomonas iridis TaxID=2710587 RepID=UPI0021C10D57|nr:hypothetical protein [Pseudomonas iridis]MCT8945614.1 hypothetical protein [Pseudomonas iridis]
MIIITPPFKENLKRPSRRTHMTTHPAIESLTEDDLINLSRVFPAPSRPQLIIVRNLLNDWRATYRTFENGTVSFDVAALVREVSFRGSPKTAARVSELVSLGVDLQALATSRLNIPMVGKELITLRLEGIRQGVV